MIPCVVERVKQPRVSQHVKLLDIVQYTPDDHVRVFSYLDEYI